MAYIPQSVYGLNQHPYPFGKLQLGTRFNSWIKFMRELHDSLNAAGGSMFDLLTELRTKLTTGGDVFALANELRARLHTGGDYQALVAELRARLITTGDMFEMLVDVSDKAYNQILTDPGWAQDGGVAADFENVNQIDAIVDGSYYAAIVAAGANYSPTSPAWDTGVGEERSVTMCVAVGGAVTAVISPVAATGLSVVPRPTSGTCPIGIVVVPASFTGGVTATGGCVFVDGFPRRIGVPVTVASAAPAAITAIDVAAVVATAPAALSTTKPADLPDVAL